METSRILHDLRHELRGVDQALTEQQAPDACSRKLHEALRLLREAHATLPPRAAPGEASPGATLDAGTDHAVVALFRLLAEQCDTIFWFEDVRQRRMLYINQAFERVWGMPLHRVQTDPDAWQEVIHPDDRGRVRREVDQWRRGISADCAIEFRIVRQDGETRWIGVHGTVLESRRGRPSRICGIAHDIGERRRTEEALRHVSQWLELAQSAACAGMWDWDIAHGRFQWSPELFQLFGIDPRAHTPGLECWRGVLHPDDLAAETAVLEQALRQGGTYDREYRIRLPDGRVRWINARGKFSLDLQGQPCRMTGICIDVSDRHRADESLRRSEERYRSLVELSPDAVFINHNDRIVFVNPAAVRLFGATSAQQLLGRSPFELTHPDYHDLIRMRIRHQQAGAVCPLVEEKVLRLDGGVVDVEVAAAPISMEEGIAFQVILRDIGDRKRGEQILAAARDQAESASRAKSDFLANMSHEIRGPMNGIMGMAQLLEFTELTDEQREYLDVIRSSSHSLLSLINDILDLSKIEAGKIELEHRPFSLRGSIGDIVKAHLTQIRDRGLVIDSSIPAAVPDSLVGDQLRLKQILANLVGNAIKFTPRGGISISVAVMGERAGTVRLRIDVADTGIGIPPEAMERIFQPFTQADSSTSRQYGGTGLGLSICTRLAELMNGGITVTSGQGRGSTFSVQLPFAVSEPSTPPPGPDSGRQRQTCWDGPPLHILLVDDYEMNLVATTRLLQRGGHSVAQARDGAEAVQAWEQERFDAVLMDIQMPVMDGMEAARTIRRKEAGSGRHTPIIALTGRALREEQDEILGQGFDGHISKPIQLGVLFQELRRCLADRTRES